METSAILAGVAFVLVAGYAGLSWLRRGRDPSYFDDSSILVPAPPPGMTAATATIISGGPKHLAFMAALLDLASRDEIAFHDEGGAGRADRVGIAIHGGDTTDARVLLNRRKPVGEGEAWLLIQLKTAVLATTERHGELPSPEMMQLGMAGLASMLRLGGGAGSDGDSPADRAQREHGMLAGGPPDLEGLAAAYTARTGKQLPQGMLRNFRVSEEAAQAMSDPAAIARDPESYAQRFEALTGRTMTPEQVDEMKQWAATAAAAKAAAAADPAPAAPEYIPAAQALTLSAPMLFGTFLDTYANRHGWIGGLPLFKRLRWRLIAAAEIAVGVILAAAGSNGRVDPLTAIGGGIAAGGLVTWLIAPSMPARTAEGAMMRAQLAAYRRTLSMTFDGATTMDDAVAKSGLTWLETPDEALVWGVALGLRSNIEALLRRTGQALRGGSAPSAYVPAWYGSATPAVGPGAALATGAVVPSTAMPDPAAMFAGIEAIGSRPPDSQRRR